MANPYPALPRDTGGSSMDEYPAPKLALAVHSSEDNSASSVITVTHNTTTLEIAAVGGAAVMRYLAVGEGSVSGVSSVISAAGTANFDHVIPSGTVRRFAIPIEGPVFQAPSSMVGINRREALYQRVAVKSVGIASVLTTEY